MATARELLDIAAGELGVCESPAGSNRTKYGAWYGLDGQPWCMMFVQWCCHRAGVKLPARTASCGGLMRVAKQFGGWVTKDLQPGDVVIYDFPGGADTDHCGIVEQVTASGIVAIEGNTSESGSQSNGGMVCRKTRPWKYIVGAVRPEFTEEDDMTGEEIYNKLNDYLRDKPAPAWAQAELAEAVALGITDGKNPMQLIPRYQAAIMAKRAAQR